MFTSPLFQANNREIDVSLVREFYRPYISAQNDFLGTVGSYDFHTLSTPPEETLDYATVIRPFDMYIWILMGFSLVIVVVTFMIGLGRVNLHSSL